jgi:hypothetical protein
MVSGIQYLHDMSYGVREDGLRTFPDIYDAAAKNGNASSGSDFNFRRLTR